MFHRCPGNFSQPFFQFSQFSLDVVRGRIVQSHGDLLEKDLAPALPYPRNVTLECSHRHPEPTRNRLVGLGRILAQSKKWPECRKKFRLATFDEFRTNRIEREFEKGDGPSPLKEAIRRQVFRSGFGSIALFRKGRVQREGHVIPPLSGKMPVPLVRKVTPEAGEKKTAQATLFTVGGAEDLPGEQLRKEPLGEILGVVNRMSLSPDEGLERIPIGRTKLFHCLIS